MTDHKITEGAFGRGPLRKILNKQAYNAHLSEAGRKRVEAALKAGVEAETKKFGLQYGVGKGHADTLAEFPTSKKYSVTERRLLRPKEREVINDSLNIFFKRKPVEPLAEKGHASITPTSSPSSKTTSDESMSARNEDGAVMESLP